MYKHKFFWLTFFVSLVLTGCSSTDSDDPVQSQTKTCQTGYGFDKNGTCQECNSSNLEVNSSGYCVEKPVLNNCELNVSGYGLNANNECVQCSANQEIVDGKCSDKTITEPVKTVKSYFIKGVAIDGYIGGANVVLGSKTVQTDATNGTWSARFDDSKPTNRTVKVSGGTDLSTGLAFEGELSNIVEESDFAEKTYPANTEPTEPESMTSVPVTPLTTLVAKTVENNSSISKSEATKQVAKSFGLDESIIGKDPIALLENGSDAEKEASANAIKQALVVQKMAESLAKSVATSSSSSDFAQVFSAVFSTVAEKLKESATSNSEINLTAILEKESETFANQIVENMKNSQTSSTDLNKFASMLVKMKSASKSISKLVTVIATMNVSTIKTGGAKGLEAVSKATEVISSKLEKDISKLANANDTDLNNIISEIEKLANAIEQVGFEAIQDQMTNLIEQAGTDKFVNLETVSSILLSDEVIADPSKAKDVNLSSAVQIKVAPEVYISGESTGSAGDTITFTAGLKNSADLVSSTILYSWSINGSFVSSSSTFSHKFTSAGTYIVSVTATSNGLSKSDSQTITIKSLGNAPEVSVHANFGTAYIDQEFVFSATSSIPDTTFVWSVDGIAQSVTGNSFSYIFSTLGTHTVSITGTVGGVSSVATMNVVAITRPVNNPSPTVDNFNLGLTDNNIFIGVLGFDDLNETYNISNGTFVTVNYSSIDSSQIDDLGNSDLILKLKINSSFTSNSTRNISVGIKITDSSNRALFAIVKDANLTHINGSLSVQSSGSVFGYGKKSGGTELHTEVEDVNFSRILSISNTNDLTINHTKLVDAIYNDVTSGNDDLAKEFFSKEGSYTVTIYVSNVDAFSGFKTDTNLSLVAPFSDKAEYISDKFNVAKLYSLSGNVNVINSNSTNPTPTCSAGQSLVNNVCVDNSVNNPAPTFSGTIANISVFSGTPINENVSSYFTDANDTLEYNLTCSPTGISINSTSGLISATPTNTSDSASVSQCKVQAKDSANQTVLSNEFNITVSPLEAP